MRGILASVERASAKTSIDKASDHKSEKN